MTTENFPLLIFQPTLGSRQEWTGICLRSIEPLDPALLERLLVEFGLADAIAGLDCLLPPDLLERLDATRLPDGFVVKPLAAAIPAPAAPKAAPRSGPGQALLLKILSQVAGDADTREIEATLKHDPQLSVHLLRLVNSVAMAPTTRITSFAHAITLLGRRQLQRWLQLLLYASQASGDQANPLMAVAAFRASLLEDLCKATGGDRTAQDEAFMIGMFSLLEALFARPLVSIIAPLHLAEEISAALLQRKGRLGDLLALTEAAERGPAETEPALTRTGIGTEVWCKSQIAALRWTIQIGREQ